MCSASSKPIAVPPPALLLPTYAIAEVGREPANALPGLLIILVPISCGGYAAVFHVAVLKQYT